MQYASDLKIKKESVASRCEVCHQMDCFDPILEQCSRCQAITIEKNKVLEVDVPFVERSSARSYVSYLLLNISITTISYALLQAFHPFLVQEKLSAFFLPMTLITSFFFMFNYRFLVHKATFFRQTLVLYGTFLSVLLVFGVYATFYTITRDTNTSITLKDFLPTIGIVEFVSLTLGHIFGLPSLIFLIFLNNFLKKYLFGNSIDKEVKKVFKQEISK